MSMSSTERVMAAVTGEWADRRAFTAVLCMYGARLTNCALPEYYTNPAAYARGQSAVREVFGVDILFSPFAFANIAEAFGSDLRYFNDQPPTVRRPAVDCAKRFLNVELPNVDDNPGLQCLREAIRLMSAEHGQQTPVAAVLPAPLDLLPLIMGMDAWMGNLLFEPELALQLADKISGFMIDLTNALISDGATLAVYTCYFLNSTIIDKQLVQNFTIPATKKVLSELKGPVILHHAGTPFLSSLDSLSGLPNVIGFVLDHRDNLTEARKIVGDNPLIIAGPMGSLLGTKSPEEVQQNCLTFLENRREDPRFILSTAASDILLDTDPECIHAIRKAVEEFSGKRTI